MMYSPIFTSCYDAVAVAVAAAAAALGRFFVCVDECNDSDH